MQDNGTEVVIKKLKVGLGAAADAEDDASEFEEKNVSVQLRSNEIDPEIGMALVSSASIFQRWDESSDIATENIKFKLQFSVPRKFRVPCAILVNDNRPNEFQLLSLSLDLPDSKKEAHFWVNSWVANAGNSDGRCFFLNKAYLPSETPAILLRLAEIQTRNRDPKLKNRSGEAGQLPYQLLRPSSEPGLTAMGIPNSITV